MAESKGARPEDRPDLPDPAGLPEIPEAPDIAPESSRPAEPAPLTPGARARRAALIGLRTATGVIGTVAAVAVLAAVGLIPLPLVGPDARGAEITPQPSDLSLLCPGAVLRLGDDAGGDASSASAVGPAVVRTGAVGTEEDSAELPGTAGTPRLITAPPSEGALLAGAQSQTVDRGRLGGFAAASCREASSSSWLVGGASTTGRTTLITLSNPGSVEATVQLRIWGETGEVTAPGLGGISVPAGTQRVLSLAGFAQGLASPVVQVESRGGQVVASLQQSVIRAVDPGGAEVIGEAAAPSSSVVIPGVRIVDALTTAQAVGLDGYTDLVTQLRLLAPGDQDATVTVSLERDDGAPVSSDALGDESAADAGTGDAGDAGTGDAGAGTDDDVTVDPGETDAGADSAGGGQSFEVDLAAGTAKDVDLQGIADGVYTVTIASDAPVVAAARAATALAVSGTDELEAPGNDFGWFESAAPLGDDALVTIASGPSPQLHLANPGSEDLELELRAADGTPTTVTVAARGSASTPVEAGATYELSGARGLVASVSFAGDGRLSSYTVAPTRPVSGPIVVRP